MRHGLLESAGLVLALVLLGGAVWTYRRGPRPAALWFAAWLALGGLVPLLQWAGAVLPSWAAIGALAARLAFLVFFVGHVPARRRWMPDSMIGRSLLGGVVFVLPFVVLLAWRVEPWGPADTSISPWFYLPWLLAREFPTALVALLFILEAVRTEEATRRPPFVWLALAFALSMVQRVAGLRWLVRFRSMRRGLEADGLEVPAWLWTFELVQAVAYVSALVVLAVAVGVAMWGWMRHRAARRVFAVFVGSLLAAAIFGLVVGGVRFDTLGPNAFRWLGIGVRSLEVLGLAVLAPWALARLADRRSDDERPLPIDLVEEEPAAASTAGHAGETAYGDPDRFHPRLGLEEREG